MSRDYFMTDPLQEAAYLDLMISSQVEECDEHYDPSPQSPACDPMEDWSLRVARAARDRGWGADPTGRILCPRHRALAEHRHGSSTGDTVEND